MNLDYTIYSDQDRNQYITNYLVCHESQYAPNESGYTATQQRELEQMADYILFGKDAEKLTNAVQRKEIAKPATKYSTYTRKQPQSLQQLMDNPAFSELQATLDPTTQKNTYLHPKPTINHNYIAGPETHNILCPYAAKCALAATCAQANEDKCYACDTWIPGMIDLWDSIAQHQHWIAVANGKQVPASPNQQSMRHWPPLTMYRHKHWLAEMRKSQYLLKDGYRSPINGGFGMTPMGPIDWESNSGHWAKIDGKPIAQLTAEEGEYPENQYYCYYTTDAGTRYRCGRAHQPYIAGQWEKFECLREHKLDFTNADHVYQIINNYRSLLKSCYDDLNGQMKWILLSFDEVVDRTVLSQVQCEILNYRIMNWTNQRIAEAIELEFGHIYNPNYISFIFKTHICTKIAKTAALMQREFAAEGNPDAWKRCSCCGELLLIDDFNFVHKYVTKDGYAARCKRCDSRIRKQTRAKAKEENNGQQNMQNMQQEQKQS